MHLYFSEALSNYFRAATVRERWRELAWPVAGVMAGLLVGAAPLPAQNDCQAVFEAMSKVMRTPTHMYTTTLTDGKPKTIETIYTANGLFSNATGTWARSGITLQQATKLEEESRKNSAHMCHYEKEEPVNGEKAVVYTTQTASGGQNLEGTIWISKSRGLPLRNEVDVTTGGAGSKNHFSVRYDYKDVNPPKL